MKVSTEEEADVRAAGKLVNERVQVYSQRFGLHDKQDLLAMVAFDCLIEGLKKNEAASKYQAPAEKIIENLIQSIDQVISP